MTNSIQLAGRISRLCLVGVVAIGGAALVVPTATAAQAGPNTPAGYHVQGLAHDKLPRGAVPATRPLPALGSHGPAFQAPASRSGVSPNVIGGTAANAGDFPSVVGIMTTFLGVDSTGKNAWFVDTCTGTVISPTKVLTAGHCDTNLPFGTTVVVAGRNTLTDDNSGGWVAGVQSTWTNPTFNLAALGNTTDVPVDDVAVLTLRHPLPSQYVPISLTAQGDQTPYAAGTQATIVGYGVTSNATNATAGTLFKATVPMQSDSTCAAAMTGYDASKMTCAGLTTGGVDTCFGDSGGPLIINGVEAGITDWGSSQCAQAGTYGVYERLSTYHSAIADDLANAGTVNSDWTGDGHADIMARDGAGNLTLYAGSGFANDGFNGFGGWGTIGNGWNAYSNLFRVFNWHGDDTESIFAEDSHGNLFEYTGDGFGGFQTGAAVQIGTGWNVFAQIMVVNNWTGDGREDLLGITPNGDLRLYESNGNGGWLNAAGVQIGNGWNIFNAVITPGVFAGDGHQALIGRTAAGDLRLYESDGHGGWVNAAGVQIGSGWNIFSRFLSVGDWSGDNKLDLLGVTPAGDLRMYSSDGHGNWLNAAGQSIGAGWGGFTSVF